MRHGHNEVTADAKTSNLGGAKNVHRLSHWIHYLLPGCYYEGHESLYAGSISKTKSGYKCLQWGLSGQRYKDNMDEAIANSYFPGGNMTASANYCRAPTDHLDGNIWCYIKEAPGYESCDVPKCNGKVRLFY